MLQYLYNAFLNMRGSFLYSVMAHAHPLRYLFLEITRKCNLNCVYCGSNCSPDWEGEELSADDWKDVLRQIAADFDPKRIMAAFTGGEPLIKEGVFELFEETGRLGFPFGMVTNGTRLTVKNARRVIRAGMRSISLSLDAPPEINDRLRGKGAARKVEQAAKNLLDEGYTGILEIISTITRPVVPHLDETRKYVASLRVPQWRLVPVFSLGRAGERADLVPTADDVRTVLEFVLSGRADAYRPCPEFGDEGYLGQRYENRVRKALFQCRAGITTAGIHHDGRIAACPELGEGFTQGNIARDRFKDVWENGYQVFRDRSWTRKGACARCDVYPTCRGGSLHLYENPGAPMGRCFYEMLNHDH